MTGVSESTDVSTLGLTPFVAAAVEELPSYADVRAQAVISSLRRGAHTVGSDSRQDPYTSERSLSIRTAKGVPWLTMTLRSRATSAKYLPLYCDRDVIRGDVTLDLQEDMRVKDIVLKYRCKVSDQISGPHELIIDHEHYIWLPKDGASSSILPKGRHVIPINVPIPYEIPNPEKPDTMIALPPTFCERGGSAAYIDHTFSVSVRKPGLQISRKITTGVGYFPRTVCGTPSLLRLLAYRNNTSVVGPELDPLGWRAYPSVSSNDITISNVEYMLAIAEPLSFAVGGSIPVFLAVRSLDPQALDRAASGSNVQLRRVVGVGHPGPGRESNASCKRIARAVFRPYEDHNRQAHEEGIRMLQGEVTIPTGTTPSFTFTNINLRYDIILCNPTSFGSPKSSKSVEMDTKPLCSARVVVTAASPRRLDGPVPSLPPAYAQ